jgi:hypothetical protein
MVIATDKFETTSAETLIFAVPDSIGVLMFGIGLVLITVLIRWLITRASGTSLEGLDEKES